MALLRTLLCMLLAGGASALTLGHRAAPPAAVRRLQPAQMAAAALRVGDMCEVISGDEKGEVGKVIAIDAKNGKIIVEGINMITKHVKPMKERVLALHKPSLLALLHRLD